AAMRPKRSLRTSCRPRARSWTPTRSGSGSPGSAVPAWSPCRRCLRPPGSSPVGDDQFANVFLVGAGFQTGALPLPPDAIEEAIRVNGVAVEKKLQAFRRGRQYVADRSALLAAAGLDKPAAAEPTLDCLIRTRADYLT